MLALLTKRRTTTSNDRMARAPRQTGWIGVDVGSRAIKYVQVALERGAWQLTQAHVIPIATPEPLDHGAVSRRVIGESLAAASVGAAQTAACTLSMALTELRSMDLPVGTNDELRQLVSQELADSVGVSQCEFTFWQTPRGDGDAELTSVTALATPTNTALTVANDLHARKLRCQLLTPLPYALARAVEMVDPDSRQVAVAALDWGCTTPSITVVKNGRPVFTRLLRDCGVSRVTDALALQLGLAPSEVWRVVASLGFHHVQRSADANGALVDRITEVAGPALRQLIQQLERTRAFLRQQYRELAPKRVWMFGGGAMLPQAVASVSAAIGVDVRIWRLPTSPPQDNAHVDPMQAILGPAIGLSAMGIDQ
jgi:Tfp pilus assembly PilM family ATPase